MANDDTIPPVGDDPYADGDGRLNSLFADEVGDDIAELLGDPTMWESPSAGLIDDVLERVVVESGDAVDADQHDPADGGSDPEPLAPVVELSRWRQVRAGLVGAAAAIVLLGGAVVLFSTTGAPPAETAFAGELVPTGLIPDVDGEVEVTPVQSGLQIDLDAPALPRRDGGEFYEGWLKLDDDRLVPIGTFHEGGDVTLWAGIELERVVAMTITLEEAVLGSSANQASSGQVVLKVDFPADLDG